MNVRPLILLAGTAAAAAVSALAANNRDAGDSQSDSDRTAPETKQRSIQDSVPPPVAAVSGGAEDPLILGGGVIEHEEGYVLQLQVRGANEEPFQFNLPENDKRVIEATISGAYYLLAVAPPLVTDPLAPAPHVRFDDEAGCYSVAIPCDRCGGCRALMEVEKPGDDQHARFLAGVCLDSIAVEPDSCPQCRTRERELTVMARGETELYYHCDELRWVVRRRIEDGPPQKFDLGLRSLSSTPSQIHEAVNRVLQHADEQS